MPEGDAVRRTADRLDKALAGAAVVRAQLRWPRVPDVDLAGAIVLGTGTYGKHLLTRFDSGWTLHTHLRMDGRWRVVAAGGRWPAGPAVRAVVGGNRWIAIGLNLGMLDLVRTRDEGRLLAHLGPDILGPDFTRPDAGPPALNAADTPAGPGPGHDDAPPGRAAHPHVPNTLPPGAEEARARALRTPRRPVADVLLDQRVVAGLGTIWVSEALWLTRTWPWTPVAQTDLPSILAAVRPRIAASAAGSSVPTSVHGRARRACRRCGTPVEVGTAGSQPRPMFYCPRCQAAQPTG